MSRKPWIAVLALPGLAALLWLGHRAGNSTDVISSENLGRPVSAGEGSKKRPRHLPLGEWREQVETVLGSHEARRSRMLARKQTVDSEICLLAVESPSEEEINSVRARLAELSSQVDPARKVRLDRMLGELIADYDPFGTEGARVIQIDIPDEPNGRLTGFTCAAGDFAEIARKFDEGSMTDLRHLRGYAAGYAGMPLARFAHLIVMDGGDP